MRVVTAVATRVTTSARIAIVAVVSPTACRAITMAAAAGAGTAATVRSKLLTSIQDHVDGRHKKGAMRDARRCGPRSSRGARTDRARIEHQPLARAARPAAVSIIGGAGAVGLACAYSILNQGAAYARAFPMLASHHLAPAALSRACHGRQPPQV